MGAVIYSVLVQSTTTIIKRSVAVTAVAYNTVCRNEELAVYLVHSHLQPVSIQYLQVTTASPEHAFR